jgi:hypothetical protein
VDEIDEHLRKLIRGLTQNDVAPACEAYKALYQIGTAAIPKIQQAVFQSKWVKIKYAEEVRYVTGLVSLAHDISETDAREISKRLIENGCDKTIKNALNAICRFSLADYTQDVIHGVTIFEHKELSTSQRINLTLEAWLGIVPEEDLRSIERIYVVPEVGQAYAGNYTPVLFNIALVWYNPFSRNSITGRLCVSHIESTLYHEIGHHVHRHTFGQDAEQEAQAEQYANRLFQLSHARWSRGFHFLRRLLFWKS